MKYANGNTIKNIAISGIAMAGGFLTRKLIINARGKTKSQPVAELHEAPWLEALKWTIMASVASGVIRLLLRRYGQKGVARLED